VSRFDRYVLSQLLALFGFFALVLIGVYWVNRAIGIFDELIGSGQRLSVFLTYMSLFLPQVIAIVLPMAAFVATVIVTIRLLSERELVVMLAAGTSPLRLARPVVMFGLGLALVAALLSNFAVPQSRVQIVDLQRSVSADVAARLTIPGRFVHPAEGITFFARDVSETGALGHVFFHDAREPDEPATYVARSAVVLGEEADARLVLFDGMILGLRQPGDRLGRVTFERFTLDLTRLVREAGAPRRGVRDFPTLATLSPSPQMLSETGASRAAFLAEGHDRLLQPVIALVLPLLAFAVVLAGGYARTGRRMPAFAAGLAAIVTLLGSNAAGSALAGNADLWWLLYIPALLAALVALGLLLFWGRGWRPGPMREVPA